MAKPFGVSIDEFAKVIGVDILTVKKKLAFEAFSRVIQKTPVLTGRARGSWNIGVGKIDLSIATVESSGARKGGHYKGAEKLNNYSDNDPFSIVYITNALEYIEALESGHSDQAPNGMVELTMNELETFIKEIVG